MEWVCARIPPFDWGEMDGAVGCDACVGDRDGCRWVVWWLLGSTAVAAAFNARHVKRGETVGKTFVAGELKRHAARVLMLRKKIKNRMRCQGTRNLVWGMDVTFLTCGQAPVPVLGILDHGTRRLLNLRPLVDRTTIGVLRLLLDVVERCGRPKFLRTDNEAIFNSCLMRLYCRRLPNLWLEARLTL